MSKWELLETTENGRWRVYKREKPLKFAQNFLGLEIIPIEEWYKESNGLTPNDYLEHLPQTFDTIIVSDARTHSERLCFLADHWKDTRDGRESWEINQSLCGRNTGMYCHFSGDDTAIKDDKVYLRFLDILQIKGENNVSNEQGTLL